MIFDINNWTHDFTIYDIELIRPDGTKEEWAFYVDTEKKIVRRRFFRDDGWIATKETPGGRDLDDEVVSAEGWTIRIGDEEQKL